MSLAEKLATLTAGVKPTVKTAPKTDRLLEKYKSILNGSKSAKHFHDKMRKFHGDMQNLHEKKAESTKNEDKAEHYMNLSEAHGMAFTGHDEMSEALRPPLNKKK